ncbi:winged helix-turn-helix domain-containing protein [Phytoactinopolyspora endophytica]|uniref:GntR family transcriptional regulator n=1 Tax=Phytoactinopolyspora endophytica TaxID=1642495 RepID=UPI00101DFA4E|nr:winged helix-turn-helix domain-containing protein [Phytoactinopolyspora endophytica]
MRLANFPPFDPEHHSPGYLYMRLADYLTERIDTGDLQPEARLPSEWAIASEFHVSVGTVRRASRELCERGLLTRLPGSGTYIASADVLAQRRRSEHDES